MNRSSSIHIAILCALALAAGTDAAAQKKVSADVQVKQAAGGKVATVTKSVCLASDGRFVTHFHTPEDYYLLTNTKGEARIYIPRTNEVLTEQSGTVSTKDELIYLFLIGRSEDLGVTQYGYKPVGTSRDGKYIKKTYVNLNDAEIPTVEIVYDNFLPIYCAYLDNTGRIVNKLYLSGYTLHGRMALPERTTGISYSLNGKDSTVIRTIYSNVRIDEDDPLLDFVIPADARKASLPTPSPSKQK